MVGLQGIRLFAKSSGQSSMVVSPALIDILHIFMCFGNSFKCMLSMTQHHESLFGQPV